MRKLFFIFGITISVISAYSQSLYMPRDVQEAFKKQTRSDDGWPGKNYWQNTARYNIAVTALPPDRNIKGIEQITYINNSPDTLRNLVIKLIQNIHKPGVPRFGNAGQDYLTSGVHVDGFTVNGQTRPWNEPQFHATWQSVRLPKALPPHDSLQLSFNWHFQISLQSGREGMIDSTTYYLAYFYPRVAVYDDYNGWDRLDFNDALEFYNDFNDYKLSVTVPKNYIVWATGELQNANEVLQPSYVQKLNESMRSDATIHVATKQDLAAKNVTKQNATNTWQWAWNNISDVALGLSDHFVWDAASVVVDNKTNRRASIQSAFNDTAADFHRMVEIEHHALGWLSNNLPGVPYPFPKMTVFQGFAGMEYPMMANDETYEEFYFARFVAEHEISHTWFPFYMGINETRYGFMDEGWATFFELLYNRSVMSKDSADMFYKQFRVNGWIADRSANEDLPIITPGENLGQQALGNNEYGKPSLAYFAVKDLLGDDMFIKCLHAFMDRWHGKHPIPWDFFNSFNDASGQNLNWFWNNWFFTNYYIDVAIQNVTVNNNTALVEIRNIGGFAVPIDLQINFTDGSTETFHKTPEIWKADQRQTTITVSAVKPIQSVKIISGIFVDADEKNNVWTK